MADAGQSDKDEKTVKNPTFEADEPQQEPPSLKSDAESGSGSSQPQQQQNYQQQPYQQQQYPYQPQQNPPQYQPPHQAQYQPQPYQPPVPAASSEVRRVFESTSPFAGVICDSRRSLEKLQLAIKILFTIVVPAHLIALIPPVAIASPHVVDSAVVLTLLPPIVGVFTCLVLSQVLLATSKAVLHLVVGSLVQMFYLIIALGTIKLVSDSGNNFNYEDQSAFVAATLVIGMVHTATYGMLVGYIILQRRHTRKLARP